MRMANGTSGFLYIGSFGSVNHFPSLLDASCFCISIEPLKFYAYIESIALDINTATKIKYFYLKITTTTTISTQKCHA